MAITLFGVVPVLAACGGTTPTSSSGGAPIAVADLAPFTGVDAILGPGYLAGCYAAATEINAAGGVLGGRRFKCQAVDTRGDPADAIPATRQMFASTSNLALVVGVTSDEASAVVPIINSNKVVVFSANGESEFDQSPFPYFYRLTPPDLLEAYAMVAIAHYKYHYQRVALAFGNDIGSQTFIQPSINAVSKAGMTLAINETLNLNAQSYRTEVAKILAAKPDVIMTEALGPAEAIFLSELKQQNGGNLIPVIGTNATIDPTWYSAVVAAVGQTQLAKYFVADSLHSDFSGPAYDVYKSNLLAASGQMANIDKYATHPQSLHMYDAVNLTALAMVEAKSATPSVFRPDINKIANGVSGAVVVHNFKDGAAAIAQGKAIRFIGAGGATHFDQYNNSTVAFDVDNYGSGGAVNIIAQVSPTDVTSLS
ncbi:MAG: ABC transporter substrate-binding protein [Candidatus Dormibacterales bacterium]